MTSFSFSWISIIVLMHLSLAPVPNARDRNFLYKASEANQAEIAFSNLAMVQSGSDSVKKIAGKSVADHQIAEQDLMILFKQMKLIRPAEMDSEHLIKLTVIKKMNGKYFDAFYLNEQNLDHQLTTGLYKIEVLEGLDSQIVKYAQKQIPMLETHLKIFHAETNKLLLSIDSVAAF